MAFRSITTVRKCDSKKQLGVSTLQIEWDYSIQSLSPAENFVSKVDGDPTIANLSLRYYHGTLASVNKESAERFLNQQNTYEGF